MPFNVKHVANSLLQRGFREARTDMSPMKIQKLLFYLNGWHLAVHNQPAIYEPFQAWSYGPVVPSLYQDLKDYGRGNITAYVKEIVWEAKSHKEEARVVSDDRTIDACRNFYEILDLVWEKYIGFSALQLSAMTHQDGTPWDTARILGMEVIPDDVTRKYFVELANPGAILR